MGSGSSKRESRRSMGNATAETVEFAVHSPSGAAAVENVDPQPLTARSKPVHHTLQPTFVDGKIVSRGRLPLTHDGSSSKSGSSSEEELVDFLASDDELLEDDMFSRVATGSSSGGTTVHHLLRTNGTASSGLSVQSMGTPNPDVFGSAARDYYVILRQVFEKAHLTAEQQDRFLDTLQTAEFSKGDYIVRQGDLGDRFFIIQSGEVRVVDEPPDGGKSRVLCVLYEGHHFGEFCLLRRQQRIASVIANTSTVCKYLDQRDFLPFVMEDSRFKTVVTELVQETERTRATRAKLSAGDKAQKVVRVDDRRISTKITANVHRHTNLIKQEVINNYTLLRKLGSGSYGRVVVCEDVQDGRTYALKIVDKAKLRRRRLGQTDDETMREVEVMKKLNHENVVDLVEVINDEPGAALYLVQEYVECGPIMTEAEYNTPLPADAARLYFRDILRGLEYVHFQNVVHRDIKPSNLLVSRRGAAKIGDFGVAAVVPGKGPSARLKIREAQGTPAFMAPELFGDEGTYDGYAADIYSLGATLYTFVVGRPPFMANTEFELVEKLHSEEVLFPRTCDPHLRNLLKRMLAKDPERRITLANVMSHDWVTMEGSDPLPPRKYVRVTDVEDCPGAPKPDGGGATAADPAKLEPSSPKALPRTASMRSQATTPSGGSPSVPAAGPPSKPLPRAASDLSMRSAGRRLPPSPLASGDEDDRSPSPGFAMPARTPPGRRTPTAADPRTPVTGSGRRPPRSGRRVSASRAKQEREAHLMYLRRRQLALLGGSTNLPDQARDVLLEQRRLGIHSHREAAVAEIVMFDTGAGASAPPEAAPAAAAAASPSPGSSPSGADAAWSLPLQRLIVRLDGRMPDTPDGPDEPWSAARSTDGSSADGSVELSDLGRALYGQSIPELMRSFSRHSSMHHMGSPSLRRMGSAKSLLRTGSQGSMPRSLLLTRDTSVESSLSSLPGSAALSRDTSVTSAASSLDAPLHPTLSSEGGRRPIARATPAPQPVSPLALGAFRGAHVYTMRRTSLLGSDNGAGAGGDASDAPRVLPWSPEAQMGAVDSAEAVVQLSPELRVRPRRRSADMVPVHVATVAIDQAAREAAKATPSHSPLRRAETQMGGSPERRTLRRHKDFVMVTESFAKKTDGSTVKKAVVFRSKAESGSLSVATAARSGLRKLSSHRNMAPLPDVMEANDDDSDSGSDFSSVDDVDDINDVFDDICEPVAQYDSDLEPLPDVDLDTDDGTSTDSRSHAATPDDDFGDFTAVDTDSDSDYGDVAAAERARSVGGGGRGRGGGAPPREMLPVFSKLPGNPVLGLKFGRAEDTGRRKTMEDVTTSIADLGKAVRFPDEVPAHAFFGVYDGHNGDDTSTRLGHLLHFNLTSTPGFVDDPQEALKQAFVTTDKDVNNAQIAREASGEAVKFSGSTAVVCVVRETPAPADDVDDDARPRPVLYVANAGDCRAVLSRAGVAVPLSVDHVASRPDELARIEAAGGWVHNGRLHGVLAVSRAFGDVEHKVLKEKCWEREFVSDPLIADPDVHMEPLKPVDEFLVIACDGLWDVMTSQQAVNFVRKRLYAHQDLDKAAAELVEKAMQLASQDNVSVVVVAFGQEGSGAGAGEHSEGKDALEDDFSHK